MQTDLVEPVRIVYIYGLVDPRTRELRYVGQTIYPERRLQGHLLLDNGRAKTAWVDELRAAGLEPEMVILCRSNEIWRFYDEQGWIDLLRSGGATLFNSLKRHNLSEGHLTSSVDYVYRGDHEFLADIDVIQYYHRDHFREIGLTDAIRIAVGRYADAIRAWFENQ